MRLGTLVLGAPLLATLLVLLCASPVRAEEEPALGRLTQEERTYLEEHVEGWADLSDERKERIARNVLRVRRLPEEERERLRRRIERLKGEREGRQGHRRGGPPPRPDQGLRRKLEHRHRLVRAVGDVFWVDLPEETRASIKEALGEHGRRAVEMATFPHILQHIAEARAAGGVTDLVLPKDLPEWKRERYRAMKGKAEAGDARAARFLAHAALMQELQAFVKALAVAGSIDEAALAAEVKRLLAKHPEAVEKARKELVRIAADPDALRRYARSRSGPRDRHGGEKRERGRALLRALEQAKPFLAEHPDLQEKARALREVLQRVLGEEGRRRGGARPAGSGPGRSSGRGRPHGPGRDRGPGRERRPEPGDPSGPGGPGGPRGPGGEPPPPDDAEGTGPR